MYPRIIHRSEEERRAAMKIKSTAERQKEERVKAGGGKDYSGIPEGVTVTKERQAKAVQENIVRARREQEKEDSKKNDISVSPMATGKPRIIHRSEEERRDAMKIKSTAERQKEEREKAGGGKDYSGIPEGVTVTKERQAKAVQENIVRAREQFIKEYGVIDATYAMLGLDPLGLVPESAKETIQEIPDKFNIESGETPLFAGQQTRINVQRDEQARREQQIRAQEAMTLPSIQVPTLDVQRGPSLTVARSKRVELEQIARAYESKVESGLEPLTESKDPLLQFVGGAAEAFAYAPTAIPRLAFGLARDPEAVAKELAQSQIETLGEQPARGLGQITAMLVGPKAVKGFKRTPYRISRAETEPGILLKIEMPLGRASEAPKGPTQYTIPTLESAPRAIEAPKGPTQTIPTLESAPRAIEAPKGPTQYTIPTLESAPRAIEAPVGRGTIRGKPTPKQPDVFVGRETQPGMVETFIRTTPEQLQQLQQRGVVFQDRGFGRAVSTEYGSFRVVEPFGEVKPSKSGPIRQRITGPETRGPGPIRQRITGPETRGPETRGREFPFRIERRLELTPAEIGFTRVRTRPGNVVSTTASEVYEVKLIEGTGRKGFFASEEAQLAPTRTRAPTVSPEFMKVPETAFKRKGGKVAVRERTTDPMKSDLQSLLTQSERMGRASTGKRVFVKPTVRTRVRTRGRSATFPLPFAQTQPITGTRKQPFVIPKVQFKPQTRSKPFVSTSPTTSGFTAPEFKTTTKTSVTTTSPARRIGTPKPPIMPEIKIPKLGRKRNETGKKKGGRRTGFEFYDIENPLAGFEQVFKGIGGRKK